MESIAYGREPAGGWRGFQQSREVKDPVSVGRGGRWGRVQGAMGELEEFRWGVQLFRYVFDGWKFYELVSLTCGMTLSLIVGLLNVA